MTGQANAQYPTRGWFTRCAKLVVATSGTLAGLAVVFGWEYLVGTVVALAACLAGVATAHIHDWWTARREQPRKHRRWLWISAATALLLLRPSAFLGIMASLAVLFLIFVAVLIGAVVVRHPAVAHYNPWYRPNQH